MVSSGPQAGSASLILRQTAQGRRRRGSASARSITWLKSRNKERASTSSELLAITAAASREAGLTFAEASPLCYFIALSALRLPHLVLSVAAAAAEASGAAVGQAGVSSTAAGAGFNGARHLLSIYL